MAKKMIKRKDGSYSQRGLWDNIRANRGSGKNPTQEMLEQESKIKNENKMGGLKKKKGGFPDMNKDGDITQADIYLRKKETGTIKKKGGAKKKKKEDKKMMYKDGGKKKMYGGMMKKKKMMGGKKKMMYETGGFIEPAIPNIDNL